MEEAGLAMHSDPIEEKEPDGLESTARHWVGVYAELVAFAATVERQGEVTGEAARRLALRRRELEARLRYWQQELARILGEKSRRTG